jgi:hypothetical protein
LKVKVGEQQHGNGTPSSTHDMGSWAPPAAKPAAPGTRSPRQGLADSAVHSFSWIKSQGMSTLLTSLSVHFSPSLLEGS